LVVKPARFRYNFQVVDSQKSPSNRHAPSHYFGARPPGTAALAVAARQQRRCGQPGVTNLRLSRWSSQGNSLRRVPLCGMGWSRNSTSPGACTVDQRV